MSKEFLTPKQIAALRAQVNLIQQCPDYDLGRTLATMVVETIPYLLDDIERQTGEIERLEKWEEGHQYCGVCGASLPYEVMHYGALGDDAGWVCTDCMNESHNSTKGDTDE